MLENYRGGKLVYQKLKKQQQQKLMNHPIQHHIQQWGIIAIYTHQESVKAKFLRHSEYEFILAEHVFLTLRWL